MVWFNVDDNMAFHPKAIEAGNAALGLWVRAGSWCCHTLTNGYVPKQIARSLGTIGQCKALVSAGLWTEVEGGYQFHEWAERQQTKEDVEARRKSERERKADLRRRARVPEGQRPDGRPDGAQDGVLESTSEPEQDSVADSTQASGYPFPSLPFPSSSSGYVEGGSLVANARENEPPPPHCEQHPGGTPQPCGACADARKRWVASKLERDELAEAEAAERAARERAAKHEAAELRARAVATCGICDDEGYHRRHVCTHDPAIENAGGGKLRAAYEAERAKAAVEPESEEAHA